MWTITIYINFGKTGDVTGCYGQKIPGGPRVKNYTWIGYDITKYNFFNGKDYKTTLIGL